MRRLTSFVLAASVSTIATYGYVARADDTSVIVHVQSQLPVIVQRRDGDAWKDACKSPCDAPLPRDAEYRVVAPAGRPSDAFRLAVPANGRVVLHVDPWGGSRSTAGGVLMVIGGVSIGIGIIALGVQSAGGISFSLNSPCAEAGSPEAVAACQQKQQQQEAARRASASNAVGIAMLVIGAVSLIGGFALSQYDATTVAQVTPPEQPRRVPAVAEAGWSAPKPRIEVPLVVVTF
jgi:hypothetical protein